MSGERPRRVAEQIQRYLSSNLIPALRDPRLGFATVTGVEVSRDLKSASVFVTIYEQDAEKRKSALEVLNGAAGLFRHEMGRGLRLRHVPSLRFCEDKSIERADRIERLIREIHERESEADERGEGESGAHESGSDAPGADESVTDGLGRDGAGADESE
jgi:ribosome-binding factor A